MNSRQRTILLLVIVAVVALFAWISLASNDPEVTAVELVRIVLSWPVVVGALVVLFVLLFRTQVADFLEHREWSFRTRGGTEFRAFQLPSPGEAEGDIPSEDDQPVSFSKEEFNQLLEYASQQQQLAERWFFRYLENFFVPNTKWVLRWIAESSPVPRVEYETFWKVLIPEPAQRETVMNVLMANGLVEESNGLVSINDTGRRFLEHLGPPWGQPGPSAGS